MTPLEELQAAHKRLSELRTTSRWVAGDNDYENHAFSVETEDGDSIAESFYLNQRDLIVTLHRTIDAQLNMLRTAAHFASGQNVDEEVLALARAINGPRNVPVGEGDGDEMIVPLSPRWKETADDECNR